MYAASDVPLRNRRNWIASKLPANKANATSTIPITTEKTRRRTSPKLKDSGCDEVDSAGVADDDEKNDGARTALTPVTRIAAMRARS